MNNTIDTTGTADNTGAEITGEGGYQGAEVTAMTTTNDSTQATPATTPKAKKAPKEKKSYPFVTKAQIAASIASDFSYACNVLVILHNRQTSFEQEVKTTKDKNRRGFMSSHAVNGSRVAEKIKRGEELNDEDVAHVQAIAPRYTKQIADHLRAEAIEADPSLAVKAACFFTDQS